MKKLFSVPVVFGMVLVISSVVFAQFFYTIPDSSKTTGERMRKMMFLQTTSAPYPYMKKMNLTTADSVWTCPDSVWVTAIYCSRFSNVKIQLRSSDTMTFPFDSLAGVPLDVKRIWKRGTDSLSWVGKIYLVGVINK